MSLALASPCDVDQIATAVEHFRLDFVELPKLLSPGPGQPGHQDRLYLWAEFFMKATQPNVSEGLMSDPIIKKTFDKLKEISAMDEAQQIARARELGMLRVSMELDEARDEGLQKGRDEGLQKGRDEGLQKGRDEGLQKGRDEGLQKGRDEGLQKGREEGRDEGAQKAQAAMIRKFMDAGMSLDQIATILKMTKKELEFLLAVNKD